jgi:hypothetical protein
MCGIVAFFAENTTLKPYKQKIEVLVEAANRRGGHSFGYVTFGREGEPLAEVRKMGRGEKLPADVFRAYGILYHARYGTSAPLKPHYSQPVRLVTGYGVHNGHVSGPENERVGRAYNDLDSCHLLHAVEDYDHAKVAGLSGYGATVVIPDRGSWAEVWADGQDVYMAATRSYFAVSSVSVKMGVKWTKHRADGETAIVTFSDEKYHGVDYTVGSMQLAEVWGWSNRYRSLTNRSEAEPVHAFEKDVDFGDDWLKDYPGLLGGKL